MEMLWHYTGTYAPRGDIGRVEDEAIARAVDWRKKPGILIQALVSTNFLDVSNDHRLIVHDWPDHAEDFVRKRLRRSSEDFLPEYGRSRDKVTTKYGQSLDEVGHTRAGKAGQGTYTSTVDEFSKKQETSSRARTKKASPRAFHDFLDLWGKPCECCGMIFAIQQADLGAQVWLQLEQQEEITDETEPIVMEGLRRHRASKPWHDGFVMTIPGFLGWSKEGRPGAPRWNDRPAPFVPEIERALPKTANQIRHDRATQEFLARPR